MALNLMSNKFSMSINLSYEELLFEKIKYHPYRMFRKMSEGESELSW